MTALVKRDVIVIGELNVDLILNQIAQFPEIGKEIISEQMNLTLGSSSAIFASNLSTLGTSVAFIGKIGKDGFASVVLDSLNSKGVDTSGIIQSETLNTGATIVLNYDQDRAMVTYPGAMEDLNEKDIDFDFFAEARHLHFSSIFLQPGIRESLPSLFSRVKALGLTTSLDPQWDPAEKWDINLTELLPTLDIFLPNKAEFLLLTGTNSIEEGINKIKNIAPNLTLVIKDGVHGAYAWKAGNLIHQPAFLNENVVDCIGAGDSFNAGLIHAFINGNSLKRCLESGAIAGAVSTTSAGGTSAFKSLVEVKKISTEVFHADF
ncbi:MAG: carbohydrate kinase family protein [Prolixibacteraceae bacterium]|nr:carbohydrate kinase family protein [Prolixibacteraceae bacterium]